MLRMNQYRRPAIGLVELMVAMALCIGIMWILAESFKLGLDMTRELNATGKMVNHIDGAKAIMTYDLSRDHFLREERPGSGPRLSQQRCDWLNNSGTGWTPPSAGFLRILSPAPSNQLTDADGFSMNIATSCALHFTSVLPPAERNLYTAKVNGVTYTSRAAEIAYFLVDSGKKTSANGQPLYKLIRRQRLVAVSRDEISQLLPGINSQDDTKVIAGRYDASTTPVTREVFTLADIRTPGLRLQVDPSTFPVVSAGTPIFGPGDPREGEDLLLSGVLSFEVQVDWSPNTAGTPLVTTDDVAGSTLGPRTVVQGNWDNPFDSLAYPGGNAGLNNLNGPGGVNGLFDTWIGPPVNPNWNTGLALATQNAEKLPLAIRVKALKIILRIFDSSTKQTRQSTFVVEM